MPIIVQSEAAECGLACLAMVAGFHGFDTDLSSLRHRFSISSHGTTLDALMAIAARLELSARALRVEVHELDKLQLPCVLHWNMGHFVVLREMGRAAAVIHDPARGVRRVALSELDQSFTGVALELTPTTDFQPVEERRRLKLSGLWTRLIGFKRNLTIVIVLSLLLQAFALASPLYLQTVVDDVVLRGDLSLLTALAIGFALLLVIDVATQALRGLVLLNISTSLNLQMATNVLNKLLNLSMSYFTKRHMGDIVSRFGSIDSIRDMLTSGFAMTVVDGVLATVTVIVLFVYDATLAWIVLGSATAYVVLRLSLYQPLRRLSEEAIVTKANADSHFMESMRSIQTIKVYQRQAQRQRTWQDLFSRTLNKTIQLGRWSIGYETLRLALFGIENIVVVYVAAQAVINGTMSIGMVFAFVSYRTRFINAIASLVEQLINFKMLELHLDRLSDIAFADSEPAAALCSREERSVLVPELLGSIQVRDLSYRYGEADAAVFDGVSFDVDAGETVAIVGSSGCGKSTLLKVLMGLYEPSSGSIDIDDRPLRSVAAYRTQIAGVMQDDQLLSGSILENITCFATEVDRDRALACAISANVHEEISRLPMQYNTLVGDLGSSLSGGQQQRIMIARALYQQPRILFLDEATSHLDVRNETILGDNIRQLAITRVVVAHRPQTISASDRVIDLDQLKA